MMPAIFPIKTLQFHNGGDLEERLSINVHNESASVVVDESPQARRGVGEPFKKWMNLNESPQGWEGVDNKDVRLFSTEIGLDSHHPLLYQSR